MGTPFIMNFGVTTSCVTGRFIEMGRGSGFCFLAGPLRGRFGEGGGVGEGVVLVECEGVQVREWMGEGVGERDLGV